MIRDFFLKQMLQRQLGTLPKEQQEKILAAFNENPEFFKQLAEKISARVKGGESQTAATMAVVSEHKDELQKLLAQ